MLYRTLSVALVLLLGGYQGGSHGAGPPHSDYKLLGPVHITRYDGDSDDLLTAGLGKTGLASPIPPDYQDPEDPTAAELRRNAIYQNYRALVDTSSGGGYGRLYGPNVDRSGVAGVGEGLIAGTEYIALADDGSGLRVTLMVQVPESFDPDRPCIVTAPSSGSRGIYGAIGTAGEWGLKHGCAVAYTDKGTGTGFHNLQENTSNQMRGLRVSATAADANFMAPLSTIQREQFNAFNPEDRWAVKHAHSQRNPEASWGRHVLQSIDFAFAMLRRQFDGLVIDPDNTLVIASSVSNGGGASLQAAEQDSTGLIDGIAVAEPQVQPRPVGALTLRQGSNPAIGGSVYGKGLLDYYTLLNLYQPCANLSPANAGAPLNLTPAVNAEARCASLRAKGLLTEDSLTGQADEAQRLINDYGFGIEQNSVQPAYYFLQVPQAIAVLYANAYGRYSVTEKLCGFSYAAVDVIGLPAALDSDKETVLFATSSGIPPTGGIEIIYDTWGPVEYKIAISHTTGQADLSLDGFLCLRNHSQKALRILEGLDEVKATANLRGKPAVIVAGRNDGVVPVNFAARPYYGGNLLTEASRSRLHYYEVKNAQHLDALNALPGFDSRFIPLHYYFNQAMDLMFDHLQNGTPLPPSQVVRTVPRGAGAPPVQVGTHLPAISANPPAADRITLSGFALTIPE